VGSWLESGTHGSCRYGNTNPGLTGISTAFKTTGLDEIIQAEGVGRKEKRPGTVLQTVK
jgi:hypothetical protein